MSKHTPGPWRWDGYFLRGADGTTVWDDGSASGEYGGYDANSPDGHLIEAAPELLEALQLAVDRCPCTVAERLSGHLVDCYAPHAQLAIAKAEGL